MFSFANDDAKMRPFWEKWKFFFNACKVDYGDSFRTAAVKMTWLWHLCRLINECMKMSQEDCIIYKVSSYGRVSLLKSTSFSSFSFFCFLFCFFQDRNYLCSPGFLGTHSVEQAVLLFRDGPVSASLSVGLKVWATMFGFNFSF